MKHIFFFAIAFFFSIAWPVGTVSISQCCILIDVLEDGVVSKTSREVWDITFNPNDKLFSIDVVSYVEMDVSFNPEHGKCWYTFVWHQVGKNIVPRGSRMYEIQTTGRRSSFDMIISLKVDEYGRVEDLTATLPIGATGKNVKTYKLNSSEQTTIITPIHNSAYRPKKE